MPTKIEWAEESWNVITGCTPISLGCLNCYAKRMARRLAGRYGYPDKPNQFRLTFHRDKITQPSVWKKPRRIFVCSMGDIAHDDVPIEWFAAVYDQIARCKQHTFMILTKRPWRLEYFMREYAVYKYGVLPNVWIGTTVESQQGADKRIPFLLNIPAAVRFISVEPMLGPINLYSNATGLSKYSRPCIEPIDCQIPGDSTPMLDWVICGAETGPGKRFMKNEWAIDLKNQCVNAGVPFFFKKDSHGNHVLYEEAPNIYRCVWDEYPLQNLISK
jgi:protein gp37